MAACEERATTAFRRFAQAAEGEGSRPTLLENIFSLRAVAWIGGAMFLAAAVRPLIPNAKYRQGGSFLLGVIGVSAIEKMFWPRK
jgi:hypothetical protein